MKPKKTWVYIVVVEWDGYGGTFSSNETELEVASLKKETAMKLAAKYEDHIDANRVYIKAVELK